MPRNFINWSCKLTFYRRERDGGGGQPPVKSEVRAQSSKVSRLWFWGIDAQEYPGGLLRLDPAFAYVEPPSSWPLPREELLMPAPDTWHFGKWSGGNNHIVVAVQMPNYTKDVSNHFNFTQIAHTQPKHNFQGIVWFFEPVFKINIISLLHKIN